MNEQEKTALTEVSAETVQQTQQQTEPEASTNDFMKDPAVLAYIDQQVQEGIQKALRGNAPKANTVDPTDQERRNFEKMTYKERLNLFNTNPHIYNKLAKGSV